MPATLGVTIGNGPRVANKNVLEWLSALHRNLSLENGS